MTRCNGRIIELDPALLSTPFKTQTKWYVLTGAACSGKTTILDELARKGFKTIPESARYYFEYEITKGRSIEEIRKDGAALQRGIAAMQLKFEHDNPVNTITFLDRAIPDSLAFYRIFGLDPNEILPECFHYHYTAVFILDQLPFPRDKPLGPEDRASSIFLDEWLVRDYTALGYRIVRVPVLPPQERLTYILDRLDG